MTNEIENKKWKGLQSIAITKSDFKLFHVSITINHEWVFKLKSKNGKDS